MESLKIYTKKMPNGMWSCYTTYDGTDHAFTCYDISAVSKMANWLRDKPVKPIWDEPVIYPPEQPIPATSYRRIKLDNF